MGAQEGWKMGPGPLGKGFRQEQERSGLLSRFCRVTWGVTGQAALEQSGMPV